MPPLFQFVGRLHPLVLHAPIGFAMALVLLELLFIARRRPMPRDIRLPLAVLTALAAVGAVASGLILHEEGGYNADTVGLHQWLSIAVGVCCLLAAVGAIVSRTKVYAAALAAAALLLVPAGHFGASMTHGENFLFEPFQPPPAPIKPAVVTDPQTGAVVPASVYASAVAPILQTYCYGCHGSERDKGGLRLHSPAAILAGGDAGPVLVPGKPDDSDLVTRLLLPLDDDDHMPPKSKPQPTEAEVAALREWIASGASFDAASPAAAVHQAIADPAPPPAPGAVPADGAAIAAVRAKLAHIEPVARGSHLLLIDFSAVSTSVNDSALTTLLTPLRDHVADLNLARTRITDESLTLIASFPNLRRLNLSSTSITDRGLDALAEHPVLADLVLTQTKLTDIAYDALTSLPALSHLYVWNAGLTPDTIAELRQELPKVTIDAGDTPDAIALAAETEIKLTDASKAPPPSAPAPANAQPPADALKPVNTTCPVAGTPIDASFAIVYKGKVVGFCCRHCIAKFLEDPAKYEANIK